MSSEVVQNLLAKSPRSISGVFLDHHVRHPVKGQVYPAVLPSISSTDSVEGMLLLNLSKIDMKMFDYFEDEGVDYIRKQVEVYVPQGSVSNIDYSLMTQHFPLLSKRNDGYFVKTSAYIWARGENTLDVSKGWDYDEFRKNHLEWYLQSTVKTTRKAFIDEYVQ